MPIGPIDTTFPRSYEVRELTELPNAPSLPRYYYPGASQVAGHDGVLLEIAPEHGARWLGVFAFGGLTPKGASGVFTTPHPHRLCVVTRGVGYLVSSEDPTSWESAPVEPILDVRPVRPPGILVFAGFDRLVAYGDEGIKWRANRVVSDWLTITEVTETEILGTGEYHWREGVRVWVDLRTGTWRREESAPRKGRRQG